jgi:hypothetical protein
MGVDDGGAQPTEVAIQLGQRGRVPVRCDGTRRVPEGDVLDAHGTEAFDVGTRRRHADDLEPGLLEGQELGTE